LTSFRVESRKGEKRGRRNRKFQRSRLIVRSRGRRGGSKKKRVGKTWRRKRTEEKKQGTKKKRGR
jgi:hypothetical protein